MEISGVISRSYYGSGIDKVSVKSRKFAGTSRCSVFSENGHLQYYVSPPMSGLKNKEKKEKKNPEMVIIKKKLKLVKGLSKNLSMFESMPMGFGLEMENGLISQVKGKNLEEASEILMGQLKQLKAEEKVMKRKKKEEKAKQKSMKMKTESSSSSSESSDSDCGDVVNMKSLRINTKTESTSPISPLIQEVEIGRSGQDCCTEITSTSCCSSSGVGASASTSTIQRSSATAMATLDGERIEVCMGGKCKKSGAAELLQEFEKRVGGVEGGSVAVVGCKCMGKCRDGPNVRVLNQCNGEKTAMAEEIGVVKAPLLTNPLCIGVGLEDVSMIVANFFGNQERNDLGGLMAA